eukprot:6467871-Amphidinium_carterae.1
MVRIVDQHSPPQPEIDIKTKGSFGIPITSAVAVSVSIISANLVFLSNSFCLLAVLSSLLGMRQESFVSGDTTTQLLVAVQRTLVLR